MVAVWQVSAGPETRRYGDLFLRYGVALIGPGDTGPWAQGRHDDEFEGSYVRRLATEVQVGDAIVLRAGVSAITAVGLIASDYQHLSQFDDVNGWDLGHARRVRWSVLPEKYDFGGAVFGAQSPRFSAVNREDVLDFVARFLKSHPTDWQTAALPVLPPIEPALGEPPNALAPLIAQARDLHQIYYSVDDFGERPREDELLIHFVVPLLRDLGWMPEHISVKWRDVDVATFRKLPRQPENVQFLIEAKRLGDGIEIALDQAKGYLEALGVSRDVVVTDGIRYRYYGADTGFTPLAYANLVNLKQSSTRLFDLMRRP